MPISRTLKIPLFSSETIVSSSFRVVAEDSSFSKKLILEVFKDRTWIGFKNRAWIGPDKMSWTVLDGRKLLDILMKLILRVFLTFKTIYYKIENSPNISLNVYLLFIFRVGCIHRWYKNGQSTDLKSGIHFSSGIKIKLFFGYYVFLERCQV